MKRRDCLACKQNDCFTCPDCKENLPPPCKELNHKYGLKKWILWVILFLLFVGCLGPFIAQCILPFLAPTIPINGLELWNDYVGIILGGVATVLSIVSLIMGFHTTQETQEQQRKAFQQYQETIQYLYRVEKAVESVDAKVGAKTKNETSATPPPPGETTVSLNEIA